MERPSLLNYLAHQILSSITKEGLFSRQYVLFGEYLEQTQLLFEICCALGYTYRDRMETFAILFFEEGKEKNVTEVLLAAAAERHEKYKIEHKNFFDFYLCTEGPEMMMRFHKYKILPTANWTDFHKVYKSIVENRVAILTLPMLGAEGIAFGYKYPELTEKLFSFVYDTDKWSMMFKAGLDIGSEPPKTIPLETMQIEAKNFIKPFVDRHYPELLSSLNLK